MFIVQIAGRLGKDPETRFTPSGQKVTTFNLAVNQRKGKEDVTVWVRVTVWGDRLDKMISFLKKGSGVVVVGRLNPPSTYVDKEGRTQISLEVTAEMIEFSPFGSTDRQEGAGSGASQQSGTAAAGYGADVEETHFSHTYNKQNGHSTLMGQGNSHQTDDDALPF